MSGSVLVLVFASSSSPDGKRKECSSSGWVSDPRLLCPEQSGIPSGGVNLLARSCLWRDRAGQVQSGGTGFGRNVEAWIIACTW